MDKNIVDLIKSAMDEKEVVEIIRRLVEIPSHPGIENQESVVAEYIKTLFDKEAIPAQVRAVADGRSNIVATLKGAGGRKSLLLTGHTDTVPPYDMQDPFTLKEVSGKFYGRGAVDMKGPLACMIGAMIAIKRAGIELQGDLIFAGVIDEEEGSRGTIALLEEGLKASGAIVGEPTDMDICIAHRGLEWLEFHFTGKTVHGGKQEEGINAIVKASNFIQRLEEKLMPKIRSRVHPIIGPSSMNYGTISGGTQPSTVAGSALLKIDRRWIPQESYQEVLGELQEVIDEMARQDSQFKCQMKVMEESVMHGGYVHQAMETSAQDPLVTTTKRAIVKAWGKEPQLTSFSAWTDGGLLSSYAKIPTIVFGPGDLESAHSSEEFIERAQIYLALLVYSLTAIEFCNE
ncbi:MAG: M20 family metallopeptidase [Tissierellia bacterium]|nr:M20 family metallopeptidase [Tissierellia bacterium]